MRTKQKQLTRGRRARRRKRADGMGADTTIAARRDQAFGELGVLEAQRRALEPAALAGDDQARSALAGLRPKLARQAVAAADLDAAADLAGAGGHAGARSSVRPETDSEPERQLTALCARRLEIAREIEAATETIAAACRAMIETGDAFARAGFRQAPIEAELSRFRDRFCFFIDTRLDFMTGARGLAGHPSYRKLSEVMLDGEAFLTLYRRAATAHGADGGMAGNRPGGDDPAGQDRPDRE